MSETASEEDDGGLFCQSCSPTTRKIGYYLTFLVGLIVFFIGFFDAIVGRVVWSIIGSIIILFCPFWIKSPKKCCIEFKDALKMTSALIYIIFLVLTILNAILKWSDVLNYIFGIGLGLSGCWYFLTFLPNGQKACIACVKSCCSSEQ